MKCGVLMKIKDFFRILAIVRVKKRNDGDLSNIDMSGLDLTVLKEDFFDDCILENVNLSNAKIKFRPRNLRGYPKTLKNVNFENTDLSYLLSEDFDDVVIEKCNFKNSGLKLDLNDDWVRNPTPTFNGVLFDEGVILTDKTKIDMETLESNCHYPFTDQQVLSAVLNHVKKMSDCDYLCSLVKDSRNDRCIKECFGISLYEYHKIIKEYIENTITYLRKFKRDTLVNLIEKMLSNMDIDDVFAFLTADNHCIDLYFQNIDFTKEEFEIINRWLVFINLRSRVSVFEHCTFDVDYKTANEKINSGSRSYSFLNYADFKNCSFTNNNFSNNSEKKVRGTPFSCNTSAYIKIGNKCNGKCEFCKNRTEHDSKTKLNNILDTLLCDEVFSHLNQIYFGGGEPSLYLNEIKRILDVYFETLESKKSFVRFPDWYMFTNGAGDWEKIEKLVLSRKYHFNGNVILSRHAIEDAENKKIIGLDYSLNDPNLRNLIDRGKVLLALTCSDQNMRNHFLLDYLKFGKDLGVKNFIIQNLESKSGTTPNVYEYFLELESYLKSLGYSKTDIVSSSYFDLNLYKKGSESVSLKRYFSPEEMDEHFMYCPKHSFDLGIDSNGNLYHDFQMIKKKYNNI